ncbi:hypothetical protein HanRHA438_Chr12g0576091 [Helianthus annuus]|nr:hypothetical protein HanHA300_Chr12g0463371 [Helianthus annuus]KAJ0507048.1 hypothetical protein HanHA89_Chr12g0488851 [Helianthus annuus]KAJ0676677.1 hypothetical protein HanLR1_Chr12g0465421 [Helianthus annuus]KAJ0679881.1 hypothetical protein HanOQP8_Chr12g0464611 [Helianthus annuus]KAJ0868577.1 hypothetical protein HanRHA438_Chr12g0576091 [Helianthus annuus]
MPSSHSATVTALVVAVGLQDGIGGSTFATALILATIVMYDATGVRLQAGRQAEVIAGGLLGIMASTIIYLISYSGNDT